MANKTLLVAQREYLENIRTKTFWIGILAFPVLIAISLGAGFVLAKLKQTQNYAVLDLGTERLADKIEKQARSGDMEKLARLLAKSDGLGGVMKTLQAELGSDLAAIGAGSGTDPAAKPPEVPAAVQEKLFDAIMKLPAGDVEALMAEQKSLASAQKYRRKSLDELGLAGLPAAEQEQQLEARLQRGELFAYFVVGKDPLAGLDDFRYFSKNVTDSDLRTWYERAATKVVQDLRIAEAGITREVATRIKQEVRFQERKRRADGSEAPVTAADKGVGWAPMAFVYMLWIAVFTAAQMLLTNTVEEKSNRIIEVLLSSVSPGQLMSGKIWGIGATGLTLTVSWAICALIGVWAAEQLMPGADLSSLAAARDPLYLASFVIYFLLGYLLYAAILVGLGSVCNSLKEAQNLLQPVFVLLIIPLVSMMFIVQEPNGVVAKVLSYVPLFTPFTMMNRAGGPPEVYEYVITTILLLASVWLAFKGAGKIFRVGVLMTGNPPKLKEILGWLKQA
ncbi:MAG: ABC transporter permease [Planctomycetes bacterium]|nr:ABC transporter permease [Planctomycetota bacterium]